MITCPSCNHQNPEGSLQDATFCGQCGFNLQAESLSTPLEETAFGTSPNLSLEEMPSPDQIPLSAGESDIMPETSVSSPIQSPWDEAEEMPQPDISQSGLPSGFPELETNETEDFTTSSLETEFGEAMSVSSDGSVMPFPEETDLESEPVQIEEELEPSFASEPESEPEVEAELESIPEIGLAAAGSMASATQLQVQKASLLHLQTNTTIEIPNDLDVVHFGKPNDHIPPDIDVSGFPDSEIVSRVHADIRIEGDVFYVEDTGSSNGTYINHTPLQKGNRHRLRTGDRIALGKGDLVTFIFQLN